MENIETLLAAVAQTQGFGDVVSTTLENSRSKTVSEGLGVRGEVRPPIAASYGKRKRGRPPKGQIAAKPQPPKRTKVEDEEEDVCFICFDGGSLVLCDRKGCPKAYHPACIKRDEAFFKSTVRWNCGWHICSVCRKASHYMCYTCTYSLCKGCTKEADYVCVRGNKGFCSTCIKIIMLIEDKDQADNESVQVDFDDQRNWEYLFKWYWVCLKEKLSLTLNELMKAKRPWKGVPAVACKPKLSAAVKGKVHNLHKSMEHLELNRPHVETSLEQNDGLRTVSNVGDYVEKKTCDKREDWPDCRKDTMKPCMDKVADEPVINKSTEHPPIEKDFGKPIKDTDNLSICKNTKNQDEHKPIIGNSTEWASKSLLEFVALMKNGDTSAMSQFDVQSLLLEYIKRKNLRDPHQKSQIICDLRLKNLFGKVRVGHFEMLKLLECHFLIKEDEKSSLVPAGFVSPVTHDTEVNEKISLPAAPVSARKRKTWERSKEKATQQNLNEYAAIDAHNMNLIYLRRNLMENLLEDQENFNDKVVDSIVRIKLSCNDQKPEVHRLVQVVGTSKVGEPYKIGEKTINVMLEVLNLDKKEIIPIDAISDQEFTEDECRWLRQSIRCGLVKPFTVGEVQKKAMALNPARVIHWREAEIKQLKHLRDRASENGRKRQLRECIDKIELLKSPEERQCRIAEVPKIHADPKMSPNYESEEDIRRVDDDSKSEFARQSYAGFPRNGGKIKSEQFIQPQDRVIEKTDTSGSHSSDKHANQENVTAPEIGTTDNLTGLLTSTATCSSTGTLQSVNNVETEKFWHYRDPNGKIQGPFSMMQLRKWSTTGQFPSDTRIWMNHEQYDSLLLTDALNGHLCGESKLSNKPALRSQENASVSSDDKSAKENVHDTSWLHSWNLLKDDNSSDIASKTLSLSACEPMEFGLPIRGQEGNEFKSALTQSCMTSESQCKNVDTTTRSSEGNLRSQNIDLNSNHMDSGLVVTTASKSPDLINIPDLHSLKPKVENVDIPGRHGLLTPKVEIIDIPDLGFLDLLSPTPRTSNEDQGIHAAEIDQSGVLNFPGPDLGASWSTAPGPTVTNEHVSTSVSDGHQIMHDSPANTPDMSSWLEILNGTIEFDALGGESVSDLLAELNAMEPQGAPLASPTSAAKFAREFLEDCTDDCFSSIWDFSSTPYPQECDTSQSSVVKKSSANSYGSSVGETSGPVYSADTGSEFHPSETNNSNQEMVSAMDPSRGTVQGNINLVTVQGNVNLVLGGPGQGMTNLGWGSNPNTSHNPLSVPWDGQRKYNDKRYTSPRDYQSSSEPGSVKGRPPRSRQSYNGGGYSRAPTRGQRLCKFYESGRCRKGANCDYLHP